VRRIDYSIASPSLPPEHGPLKVGFLSDLHAGPTTSRTALEQAFAHLRAFRPDLLLLGGDYVLFDARHADSLEPLIRSIEVPLGKYAVLGNHDLWADDRQIARVLERAGATLLVNQTARVPGASFLSVGGLDDAWAGAPSYPGAFAGAAAVHLLLMHSPDHIPWLEGWFFTLALCGHTHGGQIALPGGAPILVTSRISKRYHFGRFELAGGPMLVSRGVGNVELPFRAFAPPDVLCVTLTNVPK
jgi:predicted MPP superfamily phosphohydrolase